MKLLPAILAALVSLVLSQAATQAESNAQKKNNQKFLPASPGYIYTFPRDHASHNRFKTEWWYYTGHLEAQNKRRFGYELTFFRSGLDQPSIATRSPWAVPDIYMAHFALTDIQGKRFYFFEKLNRPGLNTAGALQNTCKIWNQGWSAQLNGKQHHLKANADNIAIDLTLEPLKHPVIHGKNGISQKADCKGCASHYYSLTKLRTAGKIKLGPEVLSVSGLSWMDHEFGSNQLTKDQIGWDWFSIQLDDNNGNNTNKQFLNTARQANSAAKAGMEDKPAGNAGTEIMLYLMRLKNGKYDPNSAGTIVLKDGKISHLERFAFTITGLSTWKSPHTGATYPSGWRISIPGENLVLTVTPDLLDQELYTSRSSGTKYWEGSCTVSGRHQDKECRGRAYVELTGYAEAFSQAI